MQHSQTQLEQIDVAPLGVDLCRQLDFERVELKQINKGYWVVIVKGQKPHAHMKVELVPNSHIRQPDYWKIMIRGCVSEDINFPCLTPYEVMLPLTAAKGVKGIEIVGSTKSQCLDIPKAKKQAA